MKKILVPLDFSAESMNALKYAVDIAKTNDNKGTIKLLHVVENTDFGSSGTMGANTDTNMSQVYMIKYLQKIKTDLTRIANMPEYKHFITDHDVVIDDTHNDVAESIARQEADVIIMGTKGASGIDEIIVGSNTEKVMMQANCPVIAIKDKNSFHGLENIVFASDFNEQLPYISQRIKRIADFYKSTVHMLSIEAPHLWDSKEVNKEKIKEFAVKNGFENYTANLYDDKTEEEGIIHFAMEKGADIVIIATHGHSGIEQLFHHCISNKLVNHAPLPIMTFNTKMEKMAGSKKVQLNGETTQNIHPDKDGREFDRDGEQLKTDDEIKESEF